MALNLPGKFTKVFTDNVSMENASIDSINTPNIDIGTGASLIASDEYLQTGGDYSLTTNTIPFSQWSGSVFSPPYFLPGRLFEISSSGTNTYATALSQSGTASVIFTTPSVLGISASFNHGNATVPLVGTVVTGSIYKPTGSLGNLGGTTLNLEAYIHTTTNIPGGGNGSAYFGYIGHTFIIQKSVNAGSSWTNLKSGSINWNYLTSVPVPVNSTNPLILQTTDLSPTTSSLYRLVVSSSVPFGFGYSITNNGATGVGGFIQISEDSYFKVTQNTYNAPALKVQGTTEFLNDIIVRGSASFDGGIIYQATIISSGSNTLGDNQSDTQTLIGTINLTGPVTVNSSYGLTANTITASIISASNGITGSLFGTSSWAQSASNALRSISASRADTASFLPVGTYQITSSWAQSASNAINAQTASFLPVGTYQITSSWAISASQALTASFLNGAFLQGGNSFGTTAILGTNDSQSLQFETSGSVRITISSSGNVGIGTTSPISKLHISDTTSSILTLSSPSSSLILSSSGAGTGAARVIIGAGRAGNGESSFDLIADPTNPFSFRFVREAGIDGNVNIANKGTGSIYIGNLDPGAASGKGQIVFYTNGIYNRLVIDSNGNVGIGTATPSSTLQVRGTGATSTTTALRVENSLAAARLTILDDGTSAFNTNHLYVSSSGNVGIGTTSPEALLDVSGNTIIRGALTASNVSASGNISSSTLHVTGNENIGGTSTITGRLTANSGITTTTITASGAISSSAGLLGTTVTATSNVTVGGTLSVTGATTLTGALTASIISASSNISSSTLRTTSDTAVGGTLNVTGATTLVGALTASNISASSNISSSTLRTTSDTAVGGTLNVTGATTLIGALTASIISASSWISGSDLRVANSATVGTTLRVTGATTLIGALTASNISASSWVSGSDLRVANSATIGTTLSVTGVSTFANDLNSPTFFSGFAGSGWKLDSISPKYSFEVDDLTVRGTMKVYELLISQIRATNGSIFVSNTGKVETVTDLGNNTYYLTFDTGSQYGHSFKVGDIIRAQRFNITASTIYQCNLVVAGVPNTQALTASFNGTYGTSSYGIGIYGAGTASITAPTGGMEFVRLGSTVDTNRQGTVYLTADDNNAPFVDVKDGVTSHDGFNTANTTKVRMGKLDGITSPLFGQLSGYGLWASGSAYLEGTINATAGKIGGFTITNDAISGTGFFLSGSATGNNFFISASNFNVKANGTITASNATLSGTITANAGAIGGWSITDSQISSSGIILTSSLYTTASISTSLLFPGSFSNGSSTSGSININGIEFYATSSLSLPPNEPTRIYFYLQSGVNIIITTINAIHAITASLNFSSSIAPYDTYLSDITASRTTYALILQAKTPGPVGDSYYVTPVIPSSSTTYFTGGSGTANILIGSALGLNTGSGVYLGGQGYFRVGDPNGKRIRWDNNDLLISSSNFTLINGNITASNATLSGTITANAGTIGGWRITDSQISSSGIILTTSSAEDTSSAILIGNATSLTTGGGIFLNGTGYFRVGDPNGKRIRWDNNDLLISSSNFTLINGNITASNATLSGTITANAGRIGGFAITQDAITGSGFFLSGSATGNDFFISSSNFNVKANGTITASAGLIGGFNTTSDKIESTGSFTSGSFTSPYISLKANGQITGSEVLLRRLQSDGNIYTHFDTSTGIIDARNVARQIISDEHQYMSIVTYTSASDSFPGAGCTLYKSKFAGSPYTNMIAVGFSGNGDIGTPWVLISSPMAVGPQSYVTHQGINAGSSFSGQSDPAKPILIATGSDLGWQTLSQYPAQLLQGENCFLISFRMLGRSVGSLSGSSSTAYSPPGTRFHRVRLLIQSASAGAGAGSGGTGDLFFRYWSNGQVLAESPGAGSPSIISGSNSFWQVTGSSTYLSRTVTSYYTGSATDTVPGYKSGVLTIPEDYQGKYVLISLQIQHFTDTVGTKIPYWMGLSTVVSNLTINTTRQFTARSQQGSILQLTPFTPANINIS